MTPSFYEFFAGGGMARAALSGWTCLYANDIDPKKAAAYRENWGDEDFHLGDVAEVRGAALPGAPDLVWGSFPCQDLSLAGRGAGLAGARSGTFREFWRVIGELEDRAPKLVVVENVCGALTSHGGRDFAEILRTFEAQGYRAGALVIDAALFGPQSRPRLFVVGRLGAAPAVLTDAAPSDPFQPKSLRRAVDRLPPESGERHVWWRLTPPERPALAPEAWVEDPPTGVRWHTREETERLLGLMTPANRAKVEAAKAEGRRRVGLLYRRTRTDAEGLRRQRAEIRFDGKAGCLRTPAGGSSRQTVLLVERERVRSRLLSAREAARLMGLPDSYRLPARYSDAYRLLGDGVVAPVVAHLADRLLRPLLQPGADERRAA